MNKKDRKEVAKLIERLNELKIQCEEIGTFIQDLADAEQDKFDSLTEGLQATEMGEQIKESADSLSNAASACEDGNISDAIEALEDI
ncbi:hypothetical protein E4188_22445 (plasmid) [Aeromonas media]|uniref:Uncharacterized protein n=1 Tax=Aeromonas media TaxID=651 RepID=A0ABX6NZ89_AERME|nr:hypothetical protein [Aeromonas media]QJT41261.1 hypothetical protein E4188_22445 [Aeromonas media]